MKANEKQSECEERQRLNATQENLEIFEDEN